MPDIPAALRNGLVVSCQPVPGGPMDNAACVTGFALAALEGGACGLRIESAAYVRAVRRATRAPLIGIVKHDLDGYAVRITPTAAHVRALCDEGADIVAFDATRRSRPEPVAALIAAAHAGGALAMADCADIEDARAALALGADFVGSTLAGYTAAGREPTAPDLALVAAMRRLTDRVIAEGSIRMPLQAMQALEAGAMTVVVGSAITRTEHVTSWFRAAMDEAAAPRAAQAGVE